MGERSKADNVAGLGLDQFRVLPADLQKALRWLDLRIDQQIRLASLAEAAGVRPRTLELHFRRYLGKTPLGWIRRTRLARARQLLLAGANASVTSVAISSGFTQFGRFAAEYRRHFGESPSQTLKVARGKLPMREVSDEALRLSWRAVTHAFMVGPGPCDRALDDVESAEQLAPGFALPKAIAAWCRSQRAAHHFSATPDLDRAQALRLATEAAQLSPCDPLVLSLCSGALTLSGRLTEADRLIERSLAADPWSPWAWVRRGWLSAYAGDDEGAMRELQITLGLMPFEPLRHLTLIGIGCVHFDAGRYDRALRWLEDGITAGPDSFWAERVLAAAAAHMGARSEARRRARGLLRKDPDLTVAIARDAWPFTRGFMDRLGDGLAMAGIPLA